ncbi:hypothetical protein ACQP60_02240 [Isoptericola variabilis]|uniref:hypothetical protein n=1 Tax=Isoptericola variabilis TaxID=139208 RepID=UPI003D20EECA
MFPEVEGGGDLGGHGAVRELEPAGGGGAPGGGVVRIEQVGLERFGQRGCLCEEDYPARVQGRDLGVVGGECVQHPVQVRQRRAFRRRLRWLGVVPAGVVPAGRVESSCFFLEQLADRRGP